jgi:hypothetical protein
VSGNAECSKLKEQANRFALNGDGETAEVVTLAARIDGGGGEDLDSLLLALLRKIPSAEKGWPATQRLRWFRTFAMNVSQIYDGDADMDEPVELKIELDKAAN